MTDKFPAKSLVGGKLGQFEIRAEIARGGMGVVYKGYQPSLDRWVALKTLPMDLAGDRDLVARFQREAEAMVRLNHANIVQIIDRGQEGGQYYFAMEFVEGPSVKDLLKSETFETDKLFDIVLQTCDGLEYAHKKGLVHRDVKPANLLYEERTGVVKIADFGIAHFSKKDEDMLTLTAQNVGMGTMNYMAPEQKVDAGSVDHRADIYALGVIVYEAFTGKLPLGKFKMPSEMNPKLPRKLDGIVQKCMQPDSEERYASCADLKADLLLAKAETHDKTLVRKVRDAIDFTVTAFKTRSHVAVSMLGCLGLAVFGFVFGVMFLLRGPGEQKKYDTARAAVTVAQTRLAALLVPGAAGTDEQKEGEKLVLAADSEKASEAKLQKLGTALEKYQRGIELASRWRNDKAAEVRVSARTIRDAARELPDDALKALAAKKLDEAEKVAAATETFDPRVTGEALGEADLAVRVAKLMQEKEKDVRSKLESAPAGDPIRKKAETELKRANDARASGDAKTALEAFKAADEAAALATKSAPQVKDPTPVVTPVTPPQPDPALARAYEAARAKVQQLGDEVAKIVGAARQLDLPDGRDELQAGSDAGIAADGLASRDPVEARKKLDTAQLMLTLSRGLALAALRARVDRDRSSAEIARVFAPEDFAAAEATFAATRTLKDAELAERLVKALVAFSSATEKGRGLAEARWKKLVAVAERSRALAEARLDGGDKGPLARVDEALAQARKAHDAELGLALETIEGAIKTCDQTDAPCPKIASLGTTFAGTKMGSDLGLDGMSGIAACAKGFVVAAGQDLRCYTARFGKAATNAVAPWKIVALASGDGDDVYAALANKKIVRYLVGNEIEAAEPLPGGLSDLPYLAWEIAYDRTRKLIYVATKDEVSVYSVETGKAPRPPIDLRTSGIVRARSMTVLADGSVVVAGHSSPTTDPEASWKFVSRHYRWDDGNHGWLPVIGRDDGPCAAAALGDNLVGLFPGAKGRLAVWPRGAPLSGPPVEILADSREGAYPLNGLRLSVFGHHAYVLDKPYVENGNDSRRQRVRVYDLKD